MKIRWFAILVAAVVALAGCKEREKTTPPPGVDLKPLPPPGSPGGGGGAPEPAPVGPSGGGGGGIHTAGSEPKGGPRPKATPKQAGSGPVAD